jgi:hypothetical protein
LADVADNDRHLSDSGKKEGCYSMRSRSSDKLRMTKEEIKG